MAGSDQLSIRPSIEAEHGRSAFQRHAFAILKTSPLSTEGHREPQVLIVSQEIGVRVRWTPAIWQAMPGVMKRAP